MARAKTFSDLLNPGPFLWPKKGDRLLRPGDDWDKQVSFSPHAFDRHVHIWSGYMRAGAALVGEAERESVDRHFLVYPILFNYRHGLELAIKWVIEQYGRYAGVSLGADALDHNLWKLWKLCKRVIVEVGSAGEEDEALHSVEQIVKDFHDLDKTATAFRYSKNKDGATIKLPDNAIDLGNVKRVMEAIDNFFSGVDVQLDANSSAADW